ncbi:MAG: hypothetical protein JXA49_03145 [Actinobacteria bacterium]|nr:hypothetical protein [Actinomycetota bacterium]
MQIYRGERTVARIASCPAADPYGTVDNMRIGIPRALSYYRYYPFLKTVIEGMDGEVVLSPSTRKSLLEKGAYQCVDDICVPVKVYFGHVLDLMEKADCLLISRLVSVEKSNCDTYTCPKMIGLPDMVRHSMEEAPKIIEHIVDLQNGSWKSSIKGIAKALGASPSVTRKAYREAMEVQSSYEKLLLAGQTPESAIEHVLNPHGAAAQDGEHSAPNSKKEHAVHKDGQIKIALIGHEYLIHDAYVSHSLPDKLRSQGVDLIYSSQVTPEAINQELGKHPEISWSFEKELLGAAYHFQGREDIDGVMLLMCFACGPDSIVGEMISREFYRSEGPAFTTMVIDEHTGEAGVATRVEAFVDLIRRSSVRL